MAVLLLAAALSNCSDTAAVQPATIAPAPNVSTSGSAPGGGSVPSAQLPAVRVSDAAGNPTSGVRVAFRASAGTISVEGGSAGTAVSTMTDASGIARLASWTLPSTPGTATVTAAVAGTSTSVTFTMVITARTVARIDKSTGDGQTAAVNTALPTALAVIARDQDGIPVPGVTVAFTVGANSGAVSTGGGQFASTVTATTDDAGLATSSWRLGNLAGTNTLTASAPNVPPMTFSATGQAGAATHLVVISPPSSVTPSGAAFTAQPAVQRRDQFENAVLVNGVSVTASVPAGYTLVGTAAAPTATTGTAAFTNLGVSGPTGPVTITFSSAGVTAASAAVTIGTGATASIAPNGSTTLSGVAGSAVGSAQLPAVVVRDAASNPVSGAAVSFTVSGGTITTASGSAPPSASVTATTDASGVARLTSWTLPSTAGTATVSAALAGASGSPVTFTATVTPGTAGTLTKTAGDNQSATVNGTVATAPAVVIRDANNNPVPNTQVSFTVATGGGAVSNGGAFSSTVNVTTSATGAASVSWRLGTTAGSNTLTASVSGLPSVSFTATGTAGTATQLVVVTPPSSPTPSGAAFTTQPAIQRRDQFGNPVLASGVSITASVPASYALVGGTSATTAGTGTATFADLGVSGAAGSVTITFSAGSLSTTASVTVTTIAPGQIQIVAGDNQQTLAGTAVSINPSVKVVDGGGNPVSGVVVDFTVPQTGGGGGVVQPASVTTNASGIATVTSWVLGNLTAAQQLNVTGNGLSTSFHATALAQLTLAPSAGNTGAGTVTGNGFNCSIPASGAATGTCALSFSWGTAVTLTAASSTGYQFSSWTGASGCSTSVACAVTLNQSATTSVGASFAPTTKTIVIHNSSSSTASGTVTSSPGSLNCAVSPTSATGTCSQSFPSLTSVTLTATPTGAGNSFSGWQGACTGTSPTCTLSSVVTGNQDVTAIFSSSSSSSYSRDFSTLANQSPISDGGAWTTLGRLTGLDWDDVAVTNGVAHGVYVNSKLGQYADPTALLSGVWSANQEAEAVIRGVDAIPAGCNQEVELRLRSNVLLHSNTGYEVIFQMKSSATTGGISYISVVRWNGLLGDWTTILMRTGYNPRDGDRIRARIVGSTISVYYNDVLQDSVVDATYTGGNPGMGFYISPFNVSSCFTSPNAFGLTSFSARALP